MKIQSGKSDASRQAALERNDDTALSQPVTSTDLFSDLIAEMLHPGLMHQSHQDESDVSNEALTDEAIEVNLSENQDVGTEKSPVLHIDQYASIPPRPMQNTPLTAASNQRTMTLNSVKSTADQSVQAYQMNHVGLDDSSLLSGSYQNLEDKMGQQIDNDILKKLFSQKDEAAPLSVNTKKETVTVSESDLMPAHYPASNLTDASGMIFNSRNGLVKDQSVDKNKYVDMLIGLGNMVMPELSLPPMLQNNKSFVGEPSATPLLDQASTFNKLDQPEYELKIELFSTAGALTKETYSANIKIYPPELGAIIAKLKVDKNSAELMIVTDNHKVKEIVEANLVQLRDNFKEADINLTKISVDVQSSQSETSGQQHQNQAAYASSLLNEQAVDLSKHNSLQKSAAASLPDSLIDTYA